jgi:multiple sugar transport system substrate-binding protein
MTHRVDRASILSNRISRRALIRGSAAGAALFTAALAGTDVGAQTPAASPAAGNFDWMKYKGTKIRVMVPINPTNDVLKAHFDEFKSKTGMDIQYDELPENNERQKLTVEFTGGNSTVDVFYTSFFQEKRLFAKNAWYDDLTPYLNDPSMTAPDFAWDDFFAGAKNAGTVDGKLVGVPTNMDTNITYYRKDLFDQAGMKPPATMDELEAAAKHFHNPPQMYGFVARGQKNSNATQIDPYLRNFGGGYFDKDGKPDVDSAGDIKAVEFYADLLRKYGPPGVTNFSWPEASALMQQGRVALYTDGAGFAGPFEDPKKSKVVGKMGYGIFPAGPAGNFPPIFANGLAIYSQSKHKEAAWYFVQWATSKSILLATLKSGTSVGRTSAWDTPNVEQGSPLPKEWFDSTLQMLKIGVPGLPDVVNVAEARDIISVGVIDVINGQDATKVMQGVQQQFAALVAKEQGS